MIFQYGGYFHTANSVAFSGVQRQYVLGQNGRPHVLRVQWGLEGKLIGIDQSDILNQLAKLIYAYGYNGQSCGFPGTPFYINNGETIGGVQVTKPPSHGAIKGAEGVTFLHWNAAIQADYPSALLGQVLNYQETMSFTDNDGRPMTVERIPANGPPIIQQTTTNSWYQGTQQGSCTTAFQPADYSAPWFPDLLRTSGNSARNRAYQSPVMQRGQAMSYTTTWKYDYISAEPFFSYPHSIG